MKSKVAFLCVCVSHISFGCDVHRLHDTLVAWMCSSLSPAFQFMFEPGCFVKDPCLGIDYPSQMECRLDKAPGLYNLWEEITKTNLKIKIKSLFVMQSKLSYIYKGKISFWRRKGFVMPSGSFLFSHQLQTQFSKILPTSKPPKQWWNLNKVSFFPCCLLKILFLDITKPSAEAKIF